MKNISANFLCALLAVIFLFYSCKNRNINYITYYNKVNEIDSIYRFKKDTLFVIKEYQKLFRKYPPKNQERIEEYATYITLADKFHKNFGGKKSLNKLLPLIAPYNNTYRDYFGLYQKYGIDSMEVRQKIAQWKKGLNKRLVDSFTIAFIRDQYEARSEFSTSKMEITDKENVELLKWTFENYGYPSMQKIGLIGNNGVFMPMINLLSHLAGSEDYPYLEAKLLGYVKSGDCRPREYAEIVDRHYLQIKKQDAPYWFYTGHSIVKDSIVVNRNRRNIGLPGLKHSRAITKDFFKELELKKK